MSEEKLDTQVRREQIAEAALAIVAAQGVRRLSVAAVARRVGLVPSGIYRHFRSKEEVLLAVLDRIEARLGENVREAREDSPEPLEQIRGLLLRHVRFIREGRAVPRIVFSDDFHRGQPERMARVQKIIAGYLGHVAELVRQGQQRGTIRADLDPATAALLFLGIVVPAGVLWHVTEGGFDVTRHAERAWLILRRAIAADPAHPPHANHKSPPGDVNDQSQGTNP
jgi:AcrR family transcriptional regulator